MIATVAQVAPTPSQRPRLRPDASADARAYDALLLEQRRLTAELNEVCRTIRNDTARRHRVKELLSQLADVRGQKRIFELRAQANARANALRRQQAGLSAEAEGLVA